MLRSVIEELQRQIVIVEDIEEYRKLKKELEKSQEEYKKLRYKDQRSYSERVLVWKNSFNKHLESRQQSNPKRMVNMAFDVLLPYENHTGSELTFEELSSAGTVRNILDHYKLKAGTSKASKIKYVKMFQRLINFLLQDVSSPERPQKELPNTMLLRGMKLKEVNYEIDNQIAMLTNSMGLEKISTKNKAKGKLIDEKEMNELKNSTRKYLMKVLDDMRQQKHLEYNAKQVSEVRNGLIMIGAIRLGRRAKEFARMTVDEAKKAERVEVNGEEFFLIEVSDQKTANSSGDPAHVPYESMEYEVLCKYISDLRSKLVNDKFCNIAFPSLPKINSNSSNDLSLSAVFKVMQKFSTSSGKKVSTRSLRGSLVTNNRRKEMSETEKRNMAKAMNHSYNTAERYYNYEDLTQAVTKTLSLSKCDDSRHEAGSSSALVTSTPSKLKLATLEPSSRDESSDLCVSSQSARLGDSSVTYDASMNSSAEIMEDPINSDSTAEESRLDVTLKTLRHKKIKSTDSSQSFLKELTEKVESIVAMMKSDGKEAELKTTKGNLCVKPVTKHLPKSMLQKCSLKCLRSVISKCLKK